MFLAKQTPRCRMGILLVHTQQGVPSRLSDESVFCEDKRPFEAKLACDFGKKDVKERFGA